MKAHFLYLQNRLRSSFWFIPGLMILAAVGFSVATLALDAWLPGLPMPLPFAPTRPEGARLVLSTIAGSMITVASLVFSLTLVTLSVAAQQLGPRLISLFMADRLTQIVLGSFLALFVYTLLILRAVQGGESPFIPSVSISAALVATVVNLLILITYVHNAAQSIQADTIVHRLASEAIDEIKTLLPLLENEPESALLPIEPAPNFDRSFEVAGGEIGYVQAIDSGALVNLADEHGVLIELALHPGAFSLENTSIATVRHEGKVNHETIGQGVRRAIAFGSKRTATQDIVYGLQGLVEIALRALSPGINDPHTAVACIHHLTAALAILARRRLPEALLRNDEGEPRLQRPPLEYADILDRCFADIRNAARGIPIVLEELADALEVLAACVISHGQRQAVEREAATLLRAVRSATMDRRDRQSIEDHLQHAAAALGTRMPSQNSDEYEP
jgi:uncharacterized membrane protein